MTSGKHVHPNLPVFQDYITFLYMPRFRCIGDACEDHCCRYWRILIDKPDYKRLRKVMDNGKAERKYFRDNVRLVPRSKITGDVHAMIRLTNQHACGFLTKDNLCSVHANYGAAVLPYVCATYPRFFAIANGRLELTGSLSCPELARQCLLQADAVELVGFDPEILQGRMPRIDYFNQDSSDAYGACVDDIRTVILRLLLAEDYPIGSRLFFTAYFAHRARDYFHQGITEIPQSRLADDIRLITSHELLDELHHEYQGLEINNALAMDIIQNILLARLPENVFPKYSDLLLKILRTYEEGYNLDSLQAGIILKLSASELYSAYRERARAIPRHVDARVQQYFRNYACNYWFKEWYKKSPDLNAHLRKLLVRIAVLRFLLFSHPKILPLLISESELNTEPTPEQIDELNQAFDSAAVEVFYLFSRTIEHSKEFLDRIDSALDDNAVAKLAHMTCLIKF